MKKYIVGFLLTIAWLACAWPAPMRTPVTIQPPTRSALLPTQVLPTPTSAPPPGFDPTPYYPAMRSEFAADVNGFGNAPRYSITLTVDLDTLQASGHERVRYTNTEPVPLNEIYFRLFPSAPGFGGAMTVTRVLVNGQAIIPQLEQQGTALRVPVTLPPDASADLTLDFAFRIPRDPKVGYAMFGRLDSVTTLPNFYPVIPVRDESGWHIEVAVEYGDETFNPTALYDVSITAPVTQVVITSGTCQTPHPGIWRCVSGPMRDFMIAMSASYRMITQTVNGVTVRSFYLPEDEPGGRRALQVASDSLRVFLRRFGEYPFAELDIVETRTRAGGIEYPGLVVITSDLYDQTDEAGYFDFVIAHEVAHQWWYSLVGSDQVNHPWLDEALTGYSVVLYYEDMYGKHAADRLLEQMFEEAYRRLLKEGRDQKVNQPVAAFSPADYSAIVYRKGALFFKALRQAIGDQRFDTFLKTYFYQNRYGIANSERMLIAAESVADRAVVRSLYDRWIESATTP